MALYLVLVKKTCFSEILQVLKCFRAYLLAGVNARGKDALRTSGKNHLGKLIWVLMNILYLEHLGYLTLLWKFAENSCLSFLLEKYFHKAELKIKLSVESGLDLMLSTLLKRIKSTKQFVNLLSVRKHLLRICSLALTNPVTQILFRKIKLFPRRRKRIDFLQAYLFSFIETVILGW